MCILRWLPHMKQLALSNYTDLGLLLNKTSFKLNPSQAHGLICGLLCGEIKEASAWEEQVTGDKKRPADLSLLQDLYELSAQQLREFSFDFQLVLPTDEEDLVTRTEALTLWCQGFLTGLEFAHITIKGTQHPKNEVSEAINDLLEIAKVKFEDVVSSAEDEEAYIELVEYVRMAVLMIYQELKGTPLPTDPIH
jgi:yecA family protein